MARLIPKSNPSDISNDSERKVAEALVSKLPKHNVVIHSFNWTAKKTQKQSELLLEGECDFIILDPKYGMLFIEVKGGILQFEPDGDGWVRILPGHGKIKLNKDPFAQLSNNMHEIASYAKSSLGASAFDFGYACAVIFPDARFLGKIPASVQREQILDASSLDRLDKAIGQVFELFHRRNRPAMNQQQFAHLKHALLPRYDVLPILHRTIENQERLLHRVTEDQKRILDVIANQNMAAIEGGAGTGKTLLAIAKSQQLAAEGFRTLLVCYNRALSGWMNQTIAEEFSNHLVIHTYHSLVRDLCDQAGTPFLDGADPRSKEFWAEAASDRLIDACKRLADDRKFDAVVVDEGQDFNPLWWISLESVFRDPDQKTSYYVFYDPRQSLFINDPLELPDELGPSFRLSTNCRNTVRIAEYCATIVEEESQTRANAPTGSEPEVVEASDWSRGFKLAQKLTKNLCNPNTHALKPSQLVILTAGTHRKYWPKEFQDVPTTDNIDTWHDNQGVLIASLYQFKGLEADAVILLTTSAARDQAQYRIEKYVACSRAKHVLHVIQIETDVQEQIEITLGGETDNSSAV